MLYFTFVYFYSMSLNLLTETLKNLILNNSIQWSFHYFAMTMVKYDGDQRVYYKYKKNGSTHYYVDCTSKKIDEEGRQLTCSYIEKREDRHKEKLKANKPHNCVYVLKKSETTLLNFFDKEKKQETSEIYSEDGLKHRLAILIGGKNLSVETGASKEFYDFIIYCISYGIYIGKKNDKPIEAQAISAYHHYKSSILTQTLIESAQIIKKQMMECFSKAVFISVAIDEGSIFGKKNVDFNIENPLLTFKPFPAQILTIKDQTAEGYTKIIYDALSNIKLYKVNIASCICDGNKAQKKAFSFEWGSSLRYKDDWLKRIIFLPCLCHRVDNAYKYHASHDDTLKAIVKKIKGYPSILNQHIEEIGAKCPLAVSTRWVYDYDVINFIKKHHRTVEDHLQLSDEENYLFDVLFIFKSLICIFENSNTRFWRAFFYLERGIRALEELSESGNPFAEGFKESLLNYTLRSEEGGLWVLGYLLTKEGCNDFKQRMAAGILRYNGEGKSFFEKRREKNKDDPLDLIIKDLVDEDEHIAVPQVNGHLVVHDSGEHMEALAHIGRLREQPVPHALIQTKHDLLLHT